MHGRKRSFVLVPRSKLYEGFFGRLFRSLPPHHPPGLTDGEKEQWLINLAAGMHETAAEANDASLDNTRIPAGYTYFGQFVDHDITFDPTSSLDRANDPNKLHNFRTPRFDLDNLYGRGPADSPYLYDVMRPGFLISGSGRNVREPDLPRNAQEVALIGDPRNDENIIVAQLQLAFINFHNAVMQALLDDSFGGNVFAEAQRIVRWHYQWVVMHDYLKKMIGVREVDGMMPTVDSPFRIRTRFFKWRNQPYMPVEFSGAAYRMGHSMIRSDYELNDRLTNLRRNINGGRIPIFLPPSSNPGELDDLRGFRPLPGFWTIQWDRFLDFGDNTPQMSRRLDEKLAFGLSAIPHGPGIENPLAALNLRRGWRLQLPSGQSVARKMGITPLPPVSGDTSDPLWHYVLREAGESGGRRLGRVGGTIVGEIFAGLLKGDPNSYLNVDPHWTPANESILNIPSAEANSFTLADIIAFSGSPVTAADVNAILDS